MWCTGLYRSHYKLTVIVVVDHFINTHTYHREENQPTVTSNAGQPENEEVAPPEPESEVDPDLSPLEPTGDTEKGHPMAGTTGLEEVW